MRWLFSLLTLTGCLGLQKAGEVPDDSGADTDSGVVVGDLAADVSSVDFGEVTVGMSASSDVTLSNTGSEVLRVAAVLDGDGGFSMTDTSIAVSGGGVSVLTLTFAPDFGGDYNTVLTLSPTDGGDALSLPVTGVGVTDDGGDSGDTADSGGDSGDSGDSGGVGTLTVSPTTYDYGQVDLGGSERTTFTVRNEGSDDLLVSSITSSNSVFSVTGGTISLPQVLSPGSSKTVEITFSPTSVHSYTADLTLTTDDAESPRFDVALAGEGADLCDVCAPLIRVNTGGDPYSFTSFTAITGLPDSRDWTISNEGDQDLVVSDVFVNNDAFAPCGEFSIAPWSSTTIRPGSSARFTITLRVTDICLEVPNPSFDMNVVHIYSNDPSQSDYVIEVGGVGI